MIRGKGSSFEQLIERTAQAYAMKRIGRIEKNPVGWERTSAKVFAMRQSVRAGATVAKTGDGNYISMVPSDVDFAGGIRGIHVEFDCKECSKDRIELTRFTRHQLDKLHLSAECGNASGFLVWFRQSNAFFWVSPLALRKMQDKALYGNGSKKSISLQDIKQALVSNGDAIELFCDKQGILDLLAAIPKMLKCLEGRKNREEAGK